MEQKNFKKLQKENNKITEEIDEFLVMCLGDLEEKEDKKEYARIWTLINKLIENELEQEEMCGE
jgi:hypothetical protein